MLLQVLKVFPRYEDDADDSTVHRVSERLRPFVDKLLQLGVAGLQGLKLNANIMDCPKVLCRLPLRHLEPEVDKSSTAQLKEITAALGKCTTLEYLCIAGCMYFDRPKRLPYLYLQEAPNLKHVHLHACFPKGRICLPPECQLRLDLHRRPKFWDKIWQSEDGCRLMGCIPAMSLNNQYRRLWPFEPQDFRVLQYLELEWPRDFTDLARLKSVPHVKLKLGDSQGAISHTDGSWQSLEI